MEAVISIRFSGRYKKGVHSCFIPRQTGQLTVGRNIRLRLRIREILHNTSTVALRVVGGDEKGSLESETVKYGHESYGTRTRK
jgi:hypothetical protein